MAGEIKNRSGGPIWIVDRTTVLSLAPEMYGQAKATGSTGAFFPTIPAAPFDEVVRIDPGGNYSVVWKLDPVSTRESPGSTSSLPHRIWDAVRNYLFFSPGTYRASFTLHVWQVKPEMADGRVKNLGQSFVLSLAREIFMDASPWVLIIGAACGAVLCFILQLLFGQFSGPGVGGISATNVTVGLSSALILSGVVTVLLSRLSSTDFLIVVKVKDFWGAVATGLVIQWFGYPLLQKLLAHVSS